ncbi:HNH endonuclease family protein [Rhizobium ruizarguesonis]
MNKRSWALPTVCNISSKIDPTPDFQRPPAWSKRQKQLLMDTILRNYDIPKLYWRKVSRPDGVQYEVIDGQQRLRTIWEYRSGGFALANDADPVDGHKIAGLTFDELPPEVMMTFDTYQLDVVIISDAVVTDDEDEIRDMFLRLQNGSALKAQEKRNAMLGNMRDFVKEIAAHPFWLNCRFSNKRFTYDQVSAQAILIELSGGPTNVKDADLTRMYKSQKNFSPHSSDAKKIRRVFDFLYRAFPEKTPELERHSVVTLYCLASLLIDGYAWQGLERIVSQWFLAFERNRAENETKSEDERDFGLVEYRRLISQSTDSDESIRARLDTFERNFFEAHPRIEPKDEIRAFSHEQRLAIFRRDGAICQLKLLCDGAKVGWGHWHADHIVPHALGGRSTVANGQVACPACNLLKGKQGDLALSL